jgi:transcriptional regulator of acetoin/glycerol metabolism
MPAKRPTSVERRPPVRHQLDVNRAAQRLGLPRSSLYQKLKKYEGAA